MDIFADVLKHNHKQMRGAVIRAAFQLGLFQLLEQTSEKTGCNLNDLAANLGLQPRRLRPLLDVLAAEGFLSSSSSEGVGHVELVDLPDHSDVSAGDWDRIAEVLSSDQPLELDDDWLEGHLQYVAGKGSLAAPILWKAIDPKPGARLLDVGGGLGAYSLAFLDHHPDNRTTLVDFPETLSLLENAAADLPQGLEMRCGDARKPLPGSGYDVVLLANVLHLYGTPDCAAIVRRAADAAADGGAVVVKDVLVLPDRTGPLVGLYFALNMALFTEAGDVHPAPAIVTWMQESGITNVRSLQIPGLDGSTVVLGERSES